MHLLELFGCFLFGYAIGSQLSSGPCRMLKEGPPVRENGSCVATLQFRCDSLKTVKVADTQEPSTALCIITYVGGTCSRATTTCTCINDSVFSVTVSSQDKRRHLKCSGTLQNEIGFDQTFSINQVACLSPVTVVPEERSTGRTAQKGPTTYVQTLIYVAVGCVTSLIIVGMLTAVALKRRGRYAVTNTQSNDPPVVIYQQHGFAHLPDRVSVPMEEAPRRPSPPSEEIKPYATSCRNVRSRPALIDRCPRVLSLPLSPTRVPDVAGASDNDDGLSAAESHEYLQPYAVLDRNDRRAYDRTHVYSS